MEKLYKLIERLAKIGITTECCYNAPWVYIRKINGKSVKEKFMGNHGFTVGFIPVRMDEPFHFTDLHKTFKLIKKYIRTEEI